MLAQFWLWTLAKHAGKPMEVVVLQTIGEPGSKDGFTSPVVAICAQDVIVVIMADTVAGGESERF